MSWQMTVLISVASGLSLGALFAYTFESIFFGAAMGSMCGPLTTFFFYLLVDYRRWDKWKK